MCRTAAREASRLSAPARRGRHAAAAGPLRRSAWRPPARTPSARALVLGYPWHTWAALAQWDRRGTVGAVDRPGAWPVTWASARARHVRACRDRSGWHPRRASGRLRYVPAAARDSATAGTSVRPEWTTRAGAAGEGP